MNERTTVNRRLLSVAVLALVLLLAASCGGSKKSTNTSGLPTGTTSTSPIPTPLPKRASGLTIRSPDGLHNFYPLITGKQNLNGYVSGQVEGRKVRILSIVAPDAFWIGKGSNQRVLIHIRLKGQPEPSIHVGQKVGIIGQLTANPPNPATLGVKDAAGKSMLDKEGAYVEVSIGDLKLG
jgi:hypothetical protein